MACDSDNYQSQLNGGTQSQPSNIWSEMESQPIDSVVWGRLYGKNIRFSSLDLNNENFSTGRGENNDLSLNTSHLPEKVLCRISKVHFRISRDSCDLSNPVYIEDLSRNGTFVNSEKIGINKKRILVNDDTISISHPNYKAFVFKDLGSNEAQGLPKDITASYYVSRKLGSGACGLVQLVYDKKTCEQYAMKIVKKNLLSENQNQLNDPNRVLNEVKIVKDLAHPCVIKMHDIIDKPDSVYMVLELMKGGDLLNRIINKKRLSEKISKLFFFQMCSAVKYLHHKGITHRDLKPDNVLLDGMDDETLLKVSDFGLSKFVQNDSIMKTLCGTPLYVAPEILSTGGRGTYTKKVDIWSLGVVLFTCLSGTLPFSDDYGSAASEQIKNGKFNFNHPSWKTVSQRAISLIKKMLVVNPDRRPTIDEVIRSPWLQDTQMLQKAYVLMKLDPEEIEDSENFLEPPLKRTRR
ncbi:ovarian-specific serine/threonine-protein kinase Lok [Teleopsis dalmanni]|uniref:ovarian-specific serine/threonine-protein kinase Lok n=1 Tax=Teleopsis dalmanni TaxID=139649 RepID=UPI0018CF48D4|nr:ovarian-specific serine/threonine-protein kinase Lok [Teleopsis dalmanni]